MKQTKRIAAAMCVGAVLTGSFTAQAAERVSVSSPNVPRVCVEGVPAAFPSADGKTLYQPVLYKDATYIPLRTVGMWMGKNVEWDEKNETATLSGSVERKFPSKQDDAYQQVGIRVLPDSGSALLRPEFEVVLDGKELDFTNARGETIYPLVFEDAIYLPLRNIGELTGFEVNWVPSSEVNQHLIFLNTAFTKEQETEMVAYVNTLYSKLEKLYDTERKLLDGFTWVTVSGTNEIGDPNGRSLLTDKNLANQIFPQIKALAQEVRNTPKPPYDVLNYYYNHIMDKMDTVIANASPMLQRVNSGDYPCDSSNISSDDVDQDLMIMLGDVEMMLDAQAMMQCVQRKSVILYK